jgi:hypothetical protein
MMKYKKIIEGILEMCSSDLSINKTNSVHFRPQANYTDRVTAEAGEVHADFCGYRVLRGQRNGSLRPLISIL